MKKEKVILVIRDGWGYRKEKKDNAVAEAKTPVSDILEKKHPKLILGASGENVGLPKGFQGNSEVGHLTIGSGRIIEQSLVRINKAIKDRSFFKKKELLEAVENCKKKGTSLHIIGLLQKEGVHAHIDHLYALLRFCKEKNFRNVYVHAITDGRDAPVKNGVKYLKELEKEFKKLGFGEIVTISGRYYALDRDKRWERTKKAYRAIVEGKGKEKFDNPLEKVKECYKKGETDEFMIPRVRKNYGGIKRGDSVIFYNFRIDRPRQLTQAMIEKEFYPWKRKALDVFFLTMTDYYKPINGKVLFKEERISNLLGEVISKENLKQLRISETEKYAHVTFFLNGQKEKALKGEDRELIPSPNVATYDKKPEMSVRKVAQSLRKKITEEKYDLIVVNLVNADMVGHSGEKKAIIKAVEEVDKATGEIVETGLRKGYCIFVLADHGNAEDQRKEWKTSHTVNDVPFIAISQKNNFKIKPLKKRRGLKDVTPTILAVMGLKKPKEMKGRVLFN